MNPLFIDIFALQVAQKYLPKESRLSTGVVGTANPGAKLSRVEARRARATESWCPCAKAGLS